jgi:hypothetical protein
MRRTPEGPAHPSRRQWGRSTTRTRGSLWRRAPKSPALVHADRGAAPLPSREPSLWRRAPESPALPSRRPWGRSTGCHAKGPAGAGPRRVLRYLRAGSGAAPLHGSEDPFSGARPRGALRFPPRRQRGRSSTRHAVDFQTVPLLHLGAAALVGAAAGATVLPDSSGLEAPRGTRGLGTTCEGPERALRIPSRRQWGRSTTDDATVPICGASNRPIHRQSDRRLKLPPTSSAALGCQPWVPSPRISFLWIQRPVPMLIATRMPFSPSERADDRIAT